MKLRTQITLFIVLILIFSLGSMTLLSYYQMKSIFNDQLRDKLTNISTYASEDFMVKDSLAGNEKFSNKVLNEHIEKIRLETNVDFIVIFNMNRIRLTHPVQENIGKSFEGGDEYRVLKNADKYVSEAKGTLGTSIRAFAPVLHEGKQVGAVCVGSTLAEIKSETYRKTEQFIPFIIVGLSLGISCAFILSSNIKHEIMGLEPKEISLLLKEKEAILKNVKEGMSLRAQNHEFMNKLHTISGLIQLEEYDDAIKYISNTANRGSDLTGIITGKIKNVNIAALLLAKYYKAEELRISFEIDKESYLNNMPVNLSDDDLSSVLGNLIENSIDAINVDGTGKIYVKIAESNDNDSLVIEVKNNGPDIPNNVKEKIFERNFSTKSDQRGYGMYIVKNIIDHANGKISFVEGTGVTWYIEIPMKDGDSN